MSISLYEVHLDRIKWLIEEEVDFLDRYFPYKNNDGTIHIEESLIDEAVEDAKKDGFDMSKLAGLIKVLRDRCKKAEFGIDVGIY